MSAFVKKVHSFPEHPLHLPEVELCMSSRQKTLHFRHPLNILEKSHGTHTLDSYSFTQSCYWMTSITPISSIATGHYQTKPGYHIRRPRGKHDWLLIATVAGEGVITYPGSQVRTTDGECILYEPQAYQDYAISPSKGVWEILWAHFLPDSRWLSHIRWTSLTKGVRYLRISNQKLRDDAFNELAAMNRYAKSQHTQSYRLAMNCLERFFVLCTLEFDQQSGLHCDHRIGKALEYLAKHATEPISVARLAAYCAMSPSRFAHAFKEQLGISPMQYAERQRIEQARELLSFSTISITEIAYNLGFSSPYHFSNRFKLHTGCRPSAYRHTTKGISHAAN
ncbi:MAG: helix-turn-helix domain-containing protein [Chitinivibrionales bacterium]|nr:helix-turn-helix domain-containing protein [Chitinivibrionales bacterium]